MITNERQHRITAAETKRFEHAIARAEQDGPAPEVDPRIHQALIAGMRSQLNDLSDELREYEALREGKIKGRVFDSLLALPDALIEGRIAGRLTQKQLGHKLGIPEQQVQRYEQMRYRGVGIERLQEVADALGIKLRKTVEYDVRGPRRRRELTSAGGERRSGHAVARSSNRSAASAVKGGKQMAGRKTGKAAASAAGKTLASHSASRSAKKAAASDLAQRGNQKVTGKKAASAAGRTLQSKGASKAARKATASDLSQAARKAKR
jgi:transcriptional regulator with XRE-family HTH domain